VKDGEGKRGKCLEGRMEWGKFGTGEGVKKRAEKMGLGKEERRGRIECGKLEVLMQGMISFCISRFILNQILGNQLVPLVTPLPIEQDHAESDNTR
jgi:hypothetical protein